MKDSLRRMMYLGIGLFSLTREKAESFFDEMVKRGEMSSEEARQYVDEVMKKGEEERHALMEDIRQQIEKMRAEMGLVTRKDLDDILERLNRLEQRQG